MINKEQILLAEEVIVHRLTELTLLDYSNIKRKLDMLNTRREEIRIALDRLRKEKSDEQNG